MLIKESKVTHMRYEADSEALDSTIIRKELGEYYLLIYTQGAGYIRQNVDDYNPKPFDENYWNEGLEKEIKEFKQRTRYL